MFNIDSRIFVMLALFIFFGSILFAHGHFKTRICESAEIVLEAHERCEARANCIIDVSAIEKLIRVNKTLAGCSKDEND